MEAPTEPPALTAFAVQRSETPPPTLSVGCSGNLSVSGVFDLGYLVDCHLEGQDFKGKHASARSSHGGGR